MPEEPAEYIRLFVKGQEGKHEGHNIRTKTVSKKGGIKGLYCVQDKMMITFLFAKASGWTRGKAKAWMKSHKFSLAMFDENGRGGLGYFDESGLTEFKTWEQLAEALDQQPGKDDVTKFIDEERIIFMWGGIHGYTAEILCKKLLFYDKMDSTKPIKLIIASPGGDLYSSFAIIDMMEYVQAPIETVGIGMVMSGGLLVFMAGDERHISQTASILSHRFWSMKGGSQADLKADAVEDDLCHQRMIDHYIKFTNLKDKKEVEANLLKETNVWLTPEEALEFGLADDYFDKDWTTPEVQEDWENHKQDNNDMILEPYPNEHACRLNSPDKYDRFARKNCEQKHNKKCIDVIYGIKAGKSEIQALRYKTKIWGASAARSHCKSRKGTFEPAKIKETGGDSVMSKKVRIFEAVKSLDWIEGDSGEPFRFSGVAFEANTESANKRFYPLDVVEDAVDRANENIDSMTIEMGHPKDENDTSPENIIGNIIEFDINEENEVTFVAELNSTRLGSDARELLKSRPLGAQALSLRAGGDLANEKAPDGHRRKRVVEMELAGLDLVKAGGFKKAKVNKIGEADSGGEETMTKDEMVRTEEFKELAEAIKDGFTKQLDEQKTKLDEALDASKKLETELAGEKQAKEEAEKKFADRELAEFKTKKIAEAEVSEKVKDLLKERVSGDNEEEVEASIKDELAYIDKVAPILKEGVKVVIPPKGIGTAPKEKSDEDILKEGNEASWKEARDNAKIKINENE